MIFQIHNFLFLKFVTSTKSKFYVKTIQETHKKMHLNFALIYIVTNGLINKIIKKKMILVIVVLVIAGQWI